MSSEVTTQLRNELLAVAWRYSKESDVTVGETERAFFEAAETLELSLPILGRAETSKLVRDLTEHLQAAAKLLPPSQRVAELLGRAINWIRKDR